MPWSWLFNADLGEQRERPPTPVFWPGEFHGLDGPQGRKEPDTTDRFSLLMLLSMTSLPFLLYIIVGTLYCFHFQNYVWAELYLLWFSYQTVQGRVWWGRAGQRRVPATQQTARGLIACWCPGPGAGKLAQLVWEAGGRGAPKKCPVPAWVGSLCSSSLSFLIWDENVPDTEPSTRTREHGGPFPPHVPGAMFCSTECPVGGCQERGEMERPWPCPRGDRERDKPLPVVLRRVRFCVTPWVVVRQAPLSIGFSRQEDWSGLPCPPLGDLPDPGIEPASLMSPAWTGRFLIASITCKGPITVALLKFNHSSIFAKWYSNVYDLNL